MRTNIRNADNSELETKLLGLFRQHAPTTIHDMLPHLSDVSINQVVSGVAVLVGTGKLEPTSPTDMGFNGPLKCHFQPTAGA